MKRPCNPVREGKRAITANTQEMKKGYYDSGWSCRRLPVLKNKLRTIKKGGRHETLSGFRLISLPIEETGNGRQVTDYPKTKWWQEVILIPVDPAIRRNNPARRKTSNKRQLKKEVTMGSYHDTGWYRQQKVVARTAAGILSAAGLKRKSNI